MNARPKHLTRGTDAGTPELAKRELLVFEWAETNKTRVKVVSQRPIDRYEQRKLISVDQYEAGDRLHGDFHRAGLEPCVGMKWSDYIDGGLAVPIQEVRAEGESFWKAMGAAGRAAHDVLWWVVCIGQPADAWASHRKHDPRSGLHTLKAALDPLVIHYRIGQHY